MASARLRLARAPMWAAFFWVALLAASSDASAQSLWSHTGATVGTHTASSAAALCTQLGSVYAAANAPGNPPSYSPPAVNYATVTGLTGTAPDRTAGCAIQFTFSNGAVTGGTVGMSEGGGCVGSSIAATGFIRQGSDPSRMSVLQCHNGCEVHFDGYTGKGSTLESGVKVWYGIGELIRTGAACSGGQPESQTGAAVPAPTCGAGQVLGTVNGVPTCATSGSSEPGGSGSSSTESTSSTSTQNNGDGTTTTTTTSTSSRTGSDGTSTTTTTTTTRTCDEAGNCEEESSTEVEGQDPEDKEGFCDENPDTAGCKSLGALTADELPKVNVPVSITRDSGWEHDMSCPADKVLSLARLTLTVPFTMLCDAADMARPIVIGVAWLSSILGFLGLARKD